MQEVKRSISIEEVKKRLDKNFQEDQYYVSGKLDPTIFADNCVFTDPTVVSKGAAHACAALWATCILALAELACMRSIRENINSRPCMQANCKARTLQLAA